MSARFILHTWQSLLRSDAKESRSLAVQERALGKSVALPGGHGIEPVIIDAGKKA